MEDDGEAKYGNCFFKIENYDIIEASHWKMIYGMIKIGLFSVKGDIV